MKLFRKNLGTTPYDYLLRYRITRAKELLAMRTSMGSPARHYGASGRRESARAASGLPEISA